MNTPMIPSRGEAHGFIGIGITILAIVFLGKLYSVLTGKRVTVQASVTGIEYDPEEAKRNWVMIVDDGDVKDVMTVHCSFEHYGTIYHKEIGTRFRADIQPGTKIWIRFREGRFSKRPYDILIDGPVVDPRECEYATGSPEHSVRDNGLGS